MQQRPDALITTYLEMTDPAQFSSAYLPDDPSRKIIQAEQPDVPFYRFLYKTVGEKWLWTDRDKLDDAALLAILAAPTTRLEVLYVRGVPAGYAELSYLPEATEIVYFGLRPEFVGQGLGKHLLSYVIAQAWAANAKRIWLHTCNLDSPVALANYQKRGFRIYKTTTEPLPENT